MTRPLFASLLMLSLASFSCEVGSPPSTLALPQVRAISIMPASASVAEVALLAVEELSSSSSPQAVAIAEYLRGQDMGLSTVETTALAETIAEQAQRHRLEPGLVLAVIDVESGFDPFAVSPAGAFGLMQILPATGEELADRLGVPWLGTRTLFDPITNVKLGVAYLEQLRDRFGDIRTALAAYNWGPGHIGNRLRRGRTVPAGYSNQVLENYTEFAQRPL